MTPGIEEAAGTPRPDPGAPGDHAEAADDRAASDGRQERGATVAGTRFAHASEAEMARILDFYDVRWDYEPTTFPILWNIDGEVVESFAPDFYLPDLEMYLEMTTLKQRLVRKKNRKLRRLKELYPDIRIKLFYARDFRAMMLKYGRYALFEAISGTPGQVVPDRQPVPDQSAVLDQPMSAAPGPDLAAEPAVAITVPAGATGAASSHPPIADATPRARWARRRRRRPAATQVGAEPESGA